MIFVCRGGGFLGGVDRPSWELLLSNNIISCLQKEIELLQLAKLDYDREETTQSALKAIELINKIKQNTQKAVENKELKNEQLNNKILKNLIADLIVKLKDEKEKKN